MRRSCSLTYNWYRKKCKVKYLHENVPVATATCSSGSNSGFKTVGYFCFFNVCEVVFTLCVLSR